MSNRSLLGIAAPALLIAGLALLPFFNKPFTIDDVTFLLQAQHMLKDPLHPTAFNMVFHGDPIRLSSGLVSGPVMATLLLPTVMHGGAEWIAHLTQLAMLILGILATAALTLRLGLGRVQAGVATLLVCCSPAVLGMASTSMPDVPAMAFGTLGIERLLSWRQSRGTAAGVASGLGAALALALAVLSRPHLLLLLGVGALLLIDDARWSAGWRRWPATLFSGAIVPLGLALLLLLGFNFVTRDPVAGHHVAGTTLSRMHLDRVPFNLVSFISQWVVMFPLAIPWIVIHRKRFFRQRRNRVVLLLAAALSVVLTPGGWRSWLPLFMPAVALGSAVLIDILAEGWRRQDRTQLGLGLWLLLSLPAVFYEHLPPKYLVASAPAMAILIARALCREEGAAIELAPSASHGDGDSDSEGMYAAASAMSDWSWVSVGISAALGLVLSVLILRADAALAEVGRRGGEIAAAEVKRGATVWMDGDWGFQWYSMQAGARPMTTGGVLPAPGDVVVVGLGGGRIEQCAHRTLVASERFGGPGGRVLGEGAGFYSNGFGPLPWSWGSGELGRVEVWRIEP